MDCTGVGSIGSGELHNIGGLVSTDVNRSDRTGVDGIDCVSGSDIAIELDCTGIDELDHVCESGTVCTGTVFCTVLLKPDGTVVFGLINFASNTDTVPCNCIMLDFI